MKAVLVINIVAAILLAACVIVYVTAGGAEADPATAYILSK
jgi:hypothetical protein